MSGDVHVRFRERLGGQFPGATRLLITGDSAQLLEQEVKPLVKQFLQERGLTLAEEKTRIVHIDQGFDFLGFNVRKYNGKLLIKPATSSIAAVTAKVKDILAAGGSLPQRVLIHRLNPVLRGWANYYRHVVSKEVFCSLDDTIWHTLGRWARRRHPGKSQAWLARRYCNAPGATGRTFTDGTATLVHLARIPIRRHVKIRADANPYDPAQAGYFAARKAAQRLSPPAPAPAWMPL